MEKALIEITDKNYPQMLEAHPRLVIDCWAEWCRPCWMIRPTFEELASSYRGRIAFGTLDCDTNPNTVSAHRVMAIPALLLIKEGDEVDRIVGVMPKEWIESRIKRLL